MSLRLELMHFTNESNGYWAHWLTDEEMNLFNSAL